MLSFADDTKISSPISTALDKINLQENINLIVKWSQQNNMQLNAEKFEFLSHKLDKENFNQLALQELPFFNEYKIYKASNNIEILPSQTVRDLGVHIDVKLNWNAHYDILIKKCKQLCGWIFSTFYTRDRTTMLMLFKSLVRSKMEYCCEVWQPYLIKDIVSLERIQRNFTCRIAGMDGLNYWERLAELKIMSLQRRREKIILVHVWKVLNGLYPNTIDMSFKHHVRSNAIKAILKPLPKAKGKLLTKYEESFLINSSKLWNVLPPSLTLITNLNCFKRELDNFLCSVPDKPPLPGYFRQTNNSLTEQCFVSRVHV